MGHRINDKQGPVIVNGQNPDIVCFNHLFFPSTMFGRLARQSMPDQLLGFETTPIDMHVVRHVQSFQTILSMHAHYKKPNSKQPFLTP
jgi:hypothetical protein